jgi:hypothetical protein
MGFITNMTVDLFSGLLKYKWKKEDTGFMTSVVLLWIINLSIGIHAVNGEHIMAGIGLGPLEISFTLHRWDKWLP